MLHCGTCRQRRAWICDTRDLIRNIPRGISRIKLEIPDFPVPVRRVKSLRETDASDVSINRCGHDKWPVVASGTEDVVSADLVDEWTDRVRRRKVMHSCRGCPGPFLPQVARARSRRIEFDA